MEIIILILKIIGVTIGLVVIGIVLLLVYVCNQKNILISYKIEPFQALNSHGTTFIMTLENTNIFGVKRIRKSAMEIPHRSDFKATIEKWDSLIGKAIK